MELSFKADYSASLTQRKHKGQRLSDSRVTQHSSWVLVSTSMEDVIKLFWLPTFPFDLSVFYKITADSRVQRSGRAESTAVCTVSAGILSVSSSSFPQRDSRVMVLRTNTRGTTDRKWTGADAAAGFTCTDTYSMYKKRRLQAGGVPSNTKRHLGWEGHCHLWSSMDNWF